MSTPPYNPLISLVILASGSGSNAAAVVEYFRKNKNVKTIGIWTNSAKSEVLKRKMGVPVNVFSPGKEDKTLLKIWKEKEATALILAGYLKPIPVIFLNKFKHRILNIHPALLPKYGGKGMFGMAVHHAVINSKDEKSGITVHVVTENYDEGPIVWQVETILKKEETAEGLQKRVLKMEHWAYPRVIEAYLQKSRLPKTSECPK